MLSFVHFISSIAYLSIFKSPTALLVFQTNYGFASCFSSSSFCSFLTNLSSSSFRAFNFSFGSTYTVLVSQAQLHAPQFEPSQLGIIFLLF